MKSNFKRFMGIILAMFMVVTMIPVTAFAEDTVVLTAADSPDYVKTADGTLELLYNGDTITGTDGKTYVGFTVAKDYQNSGARFGVGFRTIATFADGSANANQNTYGQFQFVSGYPQTYSDYIDVIKDSLPQKIQDGLYLNTWTGGSTYFLDSPKPVEGKSVAYISLPSGDNMLRHGTYLASNMNDNQNPGLTGLVTYKNAMVRDYEAYGYKIYDPDDGTVKNSGSTKPFCYGSIFPTFYLSLDTLKKAKMDVATMGANVKALYASSFIQDDFAGSDYTEEELTTLGIVTVPANPTPAHSPNYLKVIANDGTIKEYLYNDTITQDGKTYIGLVGVKDISSYSDGRLGANLRPIDGGTDYEGVELPSDSNLYVSTNISDSWSNKSYKEINSNYMSWVPTVMQNHLLKYNYDCGKNLVVASAGTTLKTIGKITIAGKDEIERHATYLKSVASSYTGTGSGYIVTRSGHGGYGFYRYKFDDGSWEKADNSYSPNGSVFMQMYVDVDMFKNVKLDLSATRSATKAMLKANFLRSDLEGIYTDAELDELGVESFTAEEKPESTASAAGVFTYDSKTFHYLDKSIEYNGKKYYQVYYQSDYMSSWTAGKGDVYYGIGEDRAEGGKYATITTSQGAEDIQDFTYFDSFGDYVISDQYEWYIGNVYLNATDTEKTQLYTKGSICLPDTYSGYLANNITVQYNSVPCPTTGFYHESAASDPVRNGYRFDGASGNATAKRVLDDSGNVIGFQGNKYCCYNIVTYISEDFFKENELNVLVTGSTVTNMITKDFTRDELAAGGWSEATLDALYNSGYTGVGLGIVAYKTGDESVAVVINNNDSVASTGAKLVVVAAYTVDGFEGVKLVNVTGNIPANYYTSKIPVDLEFGDAEITEIKVMLWDGVLTAKPLADSVTVK